MNIKKMFKKGFTLIELIVVMGIVAILVGVSIGTYVGITSKAKTGAFDADAKTAYTQFYSRQIEQTAVNNDFDFKAMYTDGEHYKVFLDANTSVDLGAWDQVTNTFSQDSTKNYIMDVNSLGFRVVLNLNNCSGVTSIYREDAHKKDIIPTDTVVFFPEINIEGIVEAKKSEKYWGCPVVYTNKEAAELYDETQVIYPKYSPRYNDAEYNWNALFNGELDIAYSSHYGESLYYDTEKGAGPEDYHNYTGFRCFYAEPDCTIYSYPQIVLDDPDDYQTTEMNPLSILFINNYIDFCYGLDGSGDHWTGDFYFDKQAESFQTVKNLTLSEGIMDITQVWEPLSAFTAIQTLNIPTTLTYIPYNLFGNGWLAKDSSNSDFIEQPIKNINFADNGNYSLDSNSFSYNKKLVSIHFPENGSVDIGDSAFQNDISIASIDIPSTTNVSIGNSAFRGCNGLPLTYTSVNPLHITKNITLPSSTIPFPNEVYLYFDNSTSEEAVAFATAFPKYSYVKYGQIPTDTLVNQLSKSYVSQLNIYSPAISDGPASGATTAVLSTNSIPAGKTLIVPYKRDENLFTAEGMNTTQNDSNPVLNEANKTMTILLQNDFDLSGELDVGGLRNNPTQKAQGLISGQYAEIDLKGHTLTVESGGVLGISGNLVDSVGGGKLIVKNGATLKSDFVVFDFYGGTFLSTNVANGNSPFNIYAMPYLNANVELDYGSSLVGYCVLYALSSHNETEVSLIGNSNSLICWDSSDTSSKIIRTQTEFTNPNDFSAYQENLAFQGAFVSNPLVFNALGIINVTTGLTDFPISPFINVSLDSGSFTLGNAFKIMPGAVVNINTSATLKFKPSSNATLYYFKTGIWAKNAYVDAASFTTIHTAYKKTYTDLYGKLGTRNKDGVLNILGNVTVNPVTSGNPLYVLSGTVNASTSAVDVLKTNKAYFVCEAMDSLMETGSNGNLFDSYSVSLLKLNGSVTNLSDVSISYTPTSDGLYTYGGSTYFFKLNSQDITFFNTSIITSYISKWNSTTEKNGHHLGVAFAESQKGTMTKADSVDSVNHTVTAGGVVYIYFNGIFVPYASGKLNTNRFNGSQVRTGSPIAVTYSTSEGRWTVGA